MAEPDSAQQPPAGAPAPYGEPVLVQQSRLHLSLVWIVPVVALLVGAVLGVRALLQAGPDLVIEFRSAEGIEPGRTQVRFKEVVVGRVTKVTLRQDRQKVAVSVSLDKSAEKLAVDDTLFWVVRPRVGTAGVSGLGTLFSGAYIGIDAGASDKQQLEFTGLEAPPVALRGEPGRSFLLSADNIGSIEVGSPIYYRRMRVGRVASYELDPAKDVVNVRVFVESPNEQLVTRESRFWNASGFDFALNASGLTVNTQSIASVITGGVAFSNPWGVAEAAPASEGQRFTLYDSEKAARSTPDGTPLRIRMVFNQAMRGLAVGAPVELAGVEIGSVRSVALQADGDLQRLPVEVVAEIYPVRLGGVWQQFVAPLGKADDAGRQFLKQLVDNGMRAQARTGNLLTGQLYVALDFVPKAPKAALDLSTEAPTVPSVPGTLSDVQPQLADIIGRLSKVKFDEIGSGLQDALKSANAATQTLQDTLKSAGAASRGLQDALASANTAIQQLSPEAQRTLADVRQTLAAAQSTLAALENNVAHADAPLQRNATQALAELQRAARALRVLGDYLQQHPEAILRGKAADADTSRPVEGAR